MKRHQLPARDISPRPPLSALGSSFRQHLNRSMTRPACRHPMKVTTRAFCGALQISPSLRFTASVQRAVSRSFQYVDLDSDSRSEPGEILLRPFTGAKVLEVRIRGRNLWLYDGIHRHVIHLVMEAGRDFAQDAESIISRIEVGEVTKDEARQLDEEPA